LPVPDHAALRAVWPEHGSLPAKIALVNSMEVPGPTQDIPLSAIRERLAPRMGHLECFALAARTREIRAWLRMPPVSQSVTSAVYLLQLLASAERAIGQHKLPVLKSLLADLAGDEASGVSRELADEVLALSRSTVPWWQAHGFSQPGVGVYDAIAAGVS
jgi:hypothetical protein